mmetsp:Transcript_8337/g.25752  ORF Transcript_8337/g.25752 Transcript_8337/m.25752 type:complete len:409 (+) Transcript_8337:50-1276(+)
MVVLVAYPEVRITKNGEWNGGMEDVFDRPSALRRSGDVSRRVAVAMCALYARLGYQEIFEGLTFTGGAWPQEDRRARLTAVSAELVGDDLYTEFVESWPGAANHSVPSDNHWEDGQPMLRGVLDDIRISGDITEVVEVCRLSLEKAQTHGFAREWTDAWTDVGLDPGEVTLVFDFFDLSPRLLGNDGRFVLLTRPTVSGRLSENDAFGFFYGGPNAKWGDYPSEFMMWRLENQIPALAVANFLMEATARRLLRATDVLLVDNLLVVEVDAAVGDEQLETLAQRTTFGLTEALDAGLARDHWDAACASLRCADSSALQVHFELKLPAVVTDDPRQRRRTPVFITCPPDLLHALHYQSTVFAPPSSEEAASLPEFQLALPSRPPPVTCSGETPSEGPSATLDNTVGEEES